MVIHPVVTLRREAKGKLLELAAPKQAVSKPRPGPATGVAGESVMQIQISEQPSKRLAQIADGIAAVLADVRAAVEDWSDMRERCRAVIAELETRPPMLPVAEIAEGLEFLRWPHDRPEERRLGDRGVRPCRSRGSPDH